jgi:hypothetical protein
MQPAALITRMQERMALDSKKFARMSTLWLTAYRYYGHILHPDQESLYAEDMMAYAVEDVAAAIRTWRMTPPPENQKPRPPMPVDIVPLLNGGDTINARAGEMASNIHTALDKFGHPHMEDAQAHLGPVAWGVVKTLGGWSYLCRESQAKNGHLFHAQVRELAKSALMRERTDRVLGQGADVMPQVLPAPRHSKPAALLPQGPLTASMEPRRLPAPSRAVDEINAMVARLSARMG